MERNSRSRRVAGVVVGYYPDLGFGYLVANGTRVGFKKAALQGFAADPRPGDYVDAGVDDDGAACSVELVQASPPCST
jgi:hypothetical protein